MRGYSLTDELALRLEAGGKLPLLVVPSLAYTCLSHSVLPPPSGLPRYPSTSELYPAVQVTPFFGRSATAPVAHASAGIILLKNMII